MPRQINASLVESPVQTSSCNMPVNGLINQLLGTCRALAQSVRKSCTPQPELGALEDGIIGSLSLWQCFFGASYKIFF